MTQTVASTGLTPANRWAIYALLIAAALGQAAGKILAVNQVDIARLEQRRISDAVARDQEKLVEKGLTGDELEAALAAKREERQTKLRLQRPFLSANDRSRWMAIRAIAENGNHEIDPFLAEPAWDTIDMVQHANRDGEQRQYSSKPPLLMVMLAGPYWLLMQLTGTDLGESPYALGRTMLLIFNGGALALMLGCVGRLVERLGRGDVDRILAMAAACFGTQLSAFAPVLNNHLFAAAVTALAADAWLTLLASGRDRVGLSAVAGAAAGLAAAFELPALSLVAVIGLSLIVLRWRETLVGFTPALLLVGAAFFGTNYWAHGSLRPPYAHRSETNPADNWYDYEYTVNGRTRDSYWRNRQGVDVGEADKAAYALHTLVGHHGVFSMTPVWLLSVAGALVLLRTGDASARQFALATLAVSAACLVFYIGLRPQKDRNYGGVTNGLRWLFWLAPLWLATMPAAAERMLRGRVGVAIIGALLALSAMSAAYPTWNPWSHPWIYRWMESLGFEVL